MKRLALLPVLSMVSVQPVLADDGVTFDEKGVTLEAGALELNLGGRVHLDGVMFDDPANGEDRETDLEFRRARLELSGKVGTVLRFRVDREFAGDGKGWRNIWASIRPRDGIEVKGGNFIVPFSMEMLQSSNTLPFAERSLASALAPNYGLGGAVSLNGRGWSASAGYFRRAVENEAGFAAERGRGVVARGAFLPVSKDGTRLHLGLGFERRWFASGKELRFSAGPGSTFAPSLMSSRGIGHIEHLTSWNGEIGGLMGPVLVQAQYIGTRIMRENKENVSFSGQTLQASWMVTGENYGYSRSSGIFTGPRLQSRMGLELAARYSRLDLQDGPIRRGVGRAVSASANLYLGRNVRLMASYTDSRANRSDGADDVHNRVGVGRFQVNF